MALAFPEPVTLPPPSGKGSYNGSVQQRRSHEDRFFVGRLSSKTTLAIIADGHGGSAVAELAVEHLPAFVVGQLSALEKASSTDEIISITRKIVLDFNAIVTSDESLKKIGSTLAMTFTLDNEAVGKIAVALNLGDARFHACCGLTGNKGSVIMSSVDHKPDTDTEKARIEALGGKVIKIYGLWRVNYVLAVSRAIGDQYMEPFVSHEPNIMIFRQDMITHLILTSDGVVDSLTNDQVAEHATSDDIIKITKGLPGNNDDISAAILWIDLVYKELATTLRKNEQLKSGFEKTHARSIGALQKALEKTVEESTRLVDEARLAHDTYFIKKLTTVEPVRAVISDVRS